MNSYRVVDTRWNELKKRNVCQFCKEEPTTVYIATSHDHTDASVSLCTCGQGKSFQEVWPKITRGIHPTYSMEDYSQYFLTEETKMNDKVNVQVNDAGRLELSSTETNTIPTVSEYQWNGMVLKLAKPGEDILETLTPDKVDLLHAAMGISGEAGELLDMVKKLVIYNKPLDEAALTNIIEELGDLEFYMQMVRNNRLILTTRLATLSANHHKLVGKANARYAKGSYSDQQAQNRLDKQEPLFTAEDIERTFLKFCTENGLKIKTKFHHSVEYDESRHFMKLDRLKHEVYSGATIKDAVMALIQGVQGRRHTLTDPGVELYFPIFMKAQGEDNVNA